MGLPKTYVEMYYFEYQMPKFQHELEIGILSCSDQSRVGLMHIGVFILLLLSGERNFGVRLNKPYTATIPMDIPVFTGDLTYFDDNTKSDFETGKDCVFNKQKTSMSKTHTLVLKPQ